jgi:alpha-mannosidase
MKLPSLLLLLAAPLAAQTAAPWPADASAYRLHMIGQAHIDPVWLWPWYEGVSVIHSTFQSALDRMNETPGFAFTASSAQFYEWVEHNDPAMIPLIRKRVEEGRWAIVGGWWVEPDVNIPSGEALVRQGLYGQMTYRRLFGRIARTGYNPDSFGHPGTLPQILKLQGLREYVFMRPMANEKSLPADLFWWQAPDGTRMLTYRIPFSYNDEGSVRRRITQTIALKEPVREMMAFYGAGDHGGGATKENIRSIAEIQKEPGAPRLLYSTPDRYFAAVRETPNLPTVAGDLQHHSVGCYTAESNVKKLNRTAELALVTAEKLAAVGAAWGVAYPKAGFTEAWKRVLFLQFHDSLAGTSLPEHYETTVPQGYGYATDFANQTMYLAAQRLAWQVPAADPDSKYLFLFNPHAWPVTANAEYDIGFPLGPPLTVEDETGKPVAHQELPASSEVNNRERIVVRVPLPAFGYRQIRIRRAQSPARPATLTATQQAMENEHLRVTFGPDGAIALFDKDAGREVFAGGAAGARGLVMDDPSDTWSHDVKAYDRQIGAFARASVSVLENGPLRARVRVRSTYGASGMSTDWILYAGSRQLEARVSLDWHEHQKMLKLSFPVIAASPKPTYEVPYGFLEREANGNEDPGQRWVDVAGSGYGLAIVNDAKYGYSVAGNDLRISIVRGAPYAHHIPHVVRPDHDVLWQDQGTQTFRMLLVPHRGTWQDADVVRAAEEFTAPLPVIYQGIHGGTRPQTDSFLSVDAPNIVVSAIKQAENGADTVVRCYETAGRATKAALDLRFAGARWSGSFRPSEIKTLRIAPGGRVREVNALEEEAQP